MCFFCFQKYEIRSWKYAAVVLISNLRRDFFQCVLFSRLLPSLHSLLGYVNVLILILT